MACQSHQPSDPTNGEAEPAWRPRILWADDDADTRDRVRQLLGDQYEVEAVTDGEAALAAARARPPDLLLCDAMIPRLDGLALLSALRNEPRTRAIPVILLSARADEESRVKSFEAGANDYVVKPFSARELLARVGSHIEMVRSRREADERVTRIMESIPDGLVIHDREWRYTWINSPAERLLGRPRSELLGKRVWDEFPHTVGGEIQRQLHRVIEEKVVCEFEGYHAGWERWYENRAFPMPGGGSAVYFRDITDRRRAEEALRQSEERFRRYFQLGLIGMAISSSTKGVLEVNDEICRILGYSREELLQKTWSDMTHPDDLAADVANFNRVMAGEIEGYAMDKRWIRKDGRVVDTAISVRCVRDENGAINCFLALLQDVTERKRAEEALRRSEALLAEAQDVAHIGSWSWDLRTNLITWSDEHYRILGLSPEKTPLMAEVAIGFIHTSDRDGALDLIRRALGTRESYECYLRVLRVDGAVRIVQSRGRAEYGDRGQPVRIFGTMQDVTERKQAEAALELAKLEAERANRVKDEFLATVSHELRAPLAAILLWAQILETDALKEGEQARGLRAIRQSAQAQQQLIEDLLDLSRMLADEMRLDVQEIDVALVVQDAVEIIRSAADAKSIGIAEMFDRSTGSIRADGARIQQVVLNLLNNAVKFTPHGGRVIVRVQRVEDSLAIRVADTGQGISAEFLPHVFERFRQAESGTTRVHGGLGLGLAISRELVELHGGTIRAESPGKGHGATFTVELPIAHAPPPTSEADPSSGPVKPEWRFVPSPVLKGIRALVVEDDPMSREVIRYLLEQCEAEVTALEDAAGALREFQANLHGRRFDVLLSDVGLPEKNGHELMREIRSLERQTGEAWSIPAVALTAYARDQDRTDALAAGFNAHVPKPVAASALVKTVARCLGRSVETPPAPSPLEPLKPSSGI